jgi:hypothetical protein
MPPCSVIGAVLGVLALLLAGMSVLLLWSLNVGEVVDIVTVGRCRFAATRAESP